MTGGYMARCWWCCITKHADKGHLRVLYGRVGGALYTTWLSGIDLIGSYGYVILSGYPAKQGNNSVFTMEDVTFKMEFFRC